MSSKQHAAIGATVMIAYEFIDAHLQNRPVNIEAMIVKGMAGAALALLPDLLEPATSPSHRRFFHSVTFAAIVIGAMTGVKPEWKQLATLVGLPVLSHPAADATTPRGLPLAQRTGKGRPPRTRERPRASRNRRPAQS